MIVLLARACFFLAKLFAFWETGTKRSFLALGPYLTARLECVFIRLYRI
jgi:hypothetical protein